MAYRALAYILGLLLVSTLWTTTGLVGTVAADEARPIQTGANAGPKPVPRRPVEQELELVQAHRLQWPGNFQPSGLTWCRGRFLTLSDRHDLEIQAFDLENPEQPLRRYLQLEWIPEPPPLHSPVAILRQMILTVFHKQYDWEGITCDDKHNLYLASESFSAVLKVPLQGDSEWITLAPHEAIQHHKLLTGENTGIEGLQWLPGNQLLLAAESRPVGLIRCQIEGAICNPLQVVVLSEEMTPATFRADDLSGLSRDGDRIYTLERYLSRVCRRNPSDFRIEQCGRFRATEHNPRFVHAKVRHGQAEGLLVQGERVFVIIDNNGRSLVAEPNSTDTWLFEFKRPPEC